MKTCTVCKIEKPKTEFYKKNSNVDGFCKQCMDCTKAIKNAANKLRGSAYFRKYTLLRTAKLANMTLEEAYKALETQEYRCKICNKHESELPKRLCLDHCHKTGQFRGMLCNSCNVGLANYRDNPELLIKAAAYLKKEKG